MDSSIPAEEGEELPGHNTFLTHSLGQNLEEVLEVVAKGVVAWIQATTTLAIISTAKLGGERVGMSLIVTKR
jgi:hypothetical protein